MNRKKILSRVKKERLDEREKQIELKSFRFGWLAVSLVLLFLVALRWNANESSTDLMLILMAQLATATFYQYIHLKNRFYLFSFFLALLSIGLGIAALLSEYGVY